MKLSIQFIIFLIILLVIGFYPFIMSKFTNLPLPDNLGSYGDMYGVLNPIISAIAFTAFVYSIIVQLKEYALQRTEMQRAIKESKEQTKQFIQQVKISKDTQIKDELYRMLSLIKQSADSVSFTYDIYDSKTNERKTITLTGQSAIRKIHINLLCKLSNMGEITPESNCFYNIRNYLLDRFENSACWIGGLIHLLEYIIRQYDQHKAYFYTKRVMSIFSNPHKFLFILFAGAEDPTKGDIIRNYLISNKIIDSRIILPFMTDKEIMNSLDNTLLAASTYNN